MKKVYGKLGGTRYGEILISCLSPVPSCLGYIAEKYGLNFTLVEGNYSEEEPMKFNTLSDFRDFCYNESRRSRTDEFSLDMGENIHVIDWTAGAGESSDINVEWSSSGITPQGILIGLLRKVDFEFHQAEPPTLKAIAKWLKSCREFTGANSDTPTLHLCPKKPIVYGERFELAYEREEQQYILKQDDNFQMLCQSEKGEKYFSKCSDAYSVTGKAIPNGLKLVIHRLKNYTGLIWVVSDKTTGIRFPENKVSGKSPSEAIDTLLKAIEEEGLMEIFTTMSLYGNQ